MSQFSAKRDQAVANEYLANHQPCSQCGAHAHRDELSAFGARCRGCFSAYCAEANGSTVVLTAEQRRAVVKRLRELLPTVGIGRGQASAVAKRLRAWQGAGKRLTDSQRWVLACCEAKVAGLPMPAWAEEGTMAGGIRGLQGAAS